MLPKKHRVSREEFKKVLGRSFLVHTPLFSLRIRESHSKEAPRIAIVVSKKVSNTAAGRNLLKRRSREAIQRIIPRLRSGNAFILFFKKEAAKLSYADLSEGIKNIFIHAKHL